MSDAFAVKSAEPCLELLVKVITINYNKANGVLKGMNMLIAEYDYDTDIAVQREEERETAFAEGEAQGIQQGFSAGSRQKALETACIMKGMQYPFADIRTITGLSIAEINDL